MDDDSTFGGTVRSARKALGLTLMQVGAKIGVDHARLSRLEHGLARPTATEVHGLVRELGLDAERALTLAAAVAPRAHGDSGGEAA